MVVAKTDLKFVVTEASGSTHTLAYYLWEDDSTAAVAKQNVVCVHGLSRTGRDFDFLATALAATGKLRVYCLDVVGRGNSTYLASESQEAYGYALYVKDAFAFVAHLQLTSVDFWVGTSMGGIIAMMMCSTQPSIITHLVLNDIGIFVTAKSLTRLLEYVGKDPLLGSLDEAKDYFKRVFKTFGDLPEHVWQHFAQTSTYPVEQDGQGVKYRLKYDPRIVSAVTAADVNLESFFVKITSDILLLHGVESDILRQEDADKMATLNSKLELVNFPHIGHAPSLAVEDQIAVVLKWILART